MVTVLQTCFPDYRLTVFEEIHRRFGKHFELATGGDYFTPDVKLCAEHKEWHTRVDNHFLFMRSLLWQHGAIRRGCDSDFVVMELNPRIRSSWVILISRRLAGAPTFLWGHARAREGVSSWTNIVRLMMMRLANGVVPYSHTQRSELARYLPAKPLFAAPNSLVPRSRCKVSPTKGDQRTDILFVGRLNASKKARLLFDAFLLAAHHFGEDVRLVFVGDGDGDERAPFALAAQQSKCSARIVFRGHIHNEDFLDTIYATACCSVSPGYVGLSSIQSFAYGVPMLAADREPHSPEIEACREGFNCVYFAANNPVDLADKLCLQWADRVVWRARSEAISATIAQQHSVEVMVDGFSDPLRPVLSG